MEKGSLPEIQSRFDVEPEPFLKAFLRTSRGKAVAGMLALALGGTVADAVLNVFPGFGFEPRQATPTTPVSPELTPTAQPPVTAAATEEGQGPMEGGVQPGVSPEATPSPPPPPAPSPSPEAAASQVAPVEPVTEEPESTAMVPPTPLPTFTPPPTPSATASATRAPSPTAASTEAPQPIPSPTPLPTETPLPAPEQEQTPLGYFFQETGIGFEEPTWAQVKFSDGTLIKVDTLANAQEILRRIRENGGLVDTAGGGGGVAFKHKDGTVVHRTAYHSDAHNAEGIFVKYENGKYLVIGPDNTVLNDEAMTDAFYFFRGGVPDDFSSKVEELILKKMGAGAALDQPMAMTFTREELGFGPKPIPRADALASRRAFQEAQARNRPQIKQPLAQRTIGGGFRVKV